MSFEVKHNIKETVVLSRSAQAFKVKKFYNCNTKTTWMGLQLLEIGHEC